MCVAVVLLAAQLNIGITQKNKANKIIIESNLEFTEILNTSPAA